MDILSTFLQHSRVSTFLQCETIMHFVRCMLVKKTFLVVCGLSAEKVSSPRTSFTTNMKNKCVGELLELKNNSSKISNCFR